MSKNIFFGLDNLSLQEFEGDSELIPLMTSEDEEEIRSEDLPKDVPILPLSSTVLFPGVVIPITASREKSVRLIREANEGDKIFGVVYSNKSGHEKSDTDNISGVGTIARILRVLKMPDGNITAVVQGKKKFEIDEIIQKEPYLRASTKEIEEQMPTSKEEFAPIVEGIRDLALQLINNNPNIPSEASIAIKNIESDVFLINFVSSNLDMPPSEKQKILEIAALKDRALKTMEYMDIELQKLRLKNNIQSKVRQDMDQQQREYFLHQQLRTIQEELGDNVYSEDLGELEKKALKKKWSKEIKKHFEKEFNKLRRMNPQVAEYATQRNYLDLLLDLPFEKYSKDRIDLKSAERFLNKDHYGLEKVKDRVLEHLAVVKIKGDMKSPILCFYGPPGVGKTSLGKSIARAIGRNYVRVSLGGLKDEAEIRGHRKTYIGAMPGRIIQSIKKAGTSNPVFVLDEIDKVGNSNYAGDPSSAMLEVLDPEQNSEFYDNFLEIGYDISKVMFIATANNLSTIPEPLRDRMEIIEVNGYTLEEKVQIAKRHVIPKLLEQHGLKKTDFKMGIPQIRKVIEGYTRESG
ncbi:LON protease, partial [Elysia marginata]